MKKIISILLMIVLISGCTFSYDLKISKDNISEVGSVLNYDKSTWNVENDKYYGKTYASYIRFIKDIYEPVYDDTVLNEDSTTKISGIDYYKSQLITESDVFGIKYSFDHSFDSYSKARLVKSCYDDFNVKTDSNKFLSIYTSSNFKCFDIYPAMDEFKVNITTSWDYKVVSSNADIVEDDKYTWVINRDNAGNKPIKIEIKKVFNWRLTLIIVVPIIIIVCVVYFVLKNKLKKDNQI